MRADACHARAGSYDEPPTKLKRRVGWVEFEGLGSHPPPEPAKEVPSGSRRRLPRSTDVCR